MPERRPPKTWIPTAALVVATAACNAGGDGDGGKDDATSGITGAGTSTGSDSGGLDTAVDTSASDSSGGAPGCLADLDCASDEVCLEGTCCASERACADACCGDGEICLVGACVTPGAECTTAQDCGPGEYCELALGGPGGGLGTPGPGQVCLEELPPNGACLATPPICGEVGADPEHCLESCEFMTEAGQLETVTEWQWGLIDADEMPDHSDVWATPTVARIYDANCDGRVDINDPPNLVFVAGNTGGTCCSCGDEAISSCKTGVLRVLDGKTGAEVWTLDKAEADSQFGFAGMSVALGDVDGDGNLEIVAMTGDRRIAIVDRERNVLAVSSETVTDDATTFGWGGGLALGDMDGDGTIEIAYGNSAFTYAGGTITKLFDGTGGTGGGGGRGLSYFVDLDGNGTQELLAGNTAYLQDGTILWKPAGVGDGFTAVGDLDEDGTPEVVLIASGNVWLLDGVTGTPEMGPIDIPQDDGHGGPPTIADFDGDGDPEIGVAGGNAYVMFEPDHVAMTLTPAWQHATKDYSSAVTGSSVFDFEGDGRAEVIYSDECFLRIIDGVTGDLRYAAPNTTFTATEAIIVADVDGDDHAEVVRVSNSANWDCNTSPWNQPDDTTGRPAWVPPDGQGFYQGVTVFGDKRDSWVGTRKVWNQHAYSVSNICDGVDGACDAGASYGELPAHPKDNWSLPWLNNFRQNVQDTGLKNAPDATVAVDVRCGTPTIVGVAVRNGGLAVLPSDVEIEVLRVDGDVVLGTVVTTKALLAGQTELIDFEVPAGEGGNADAYYARIVVDPIAPQFQQCRDDNDVSAPDTALCGAG